MRGTPLLNLLPTLLGELLDSGTCCLALEVALDPDDGLEVISHADPVILGLGPELPLLLGQLQSR